MLTFVSMEGTKRQKKRRKVDYFAVSILLNYSRFKVEKYYDETVSCSRMQSYKGVKINWCT